MKKTIFVLICLLIATVCWALESAPSNEVGFYKINAVAGGYTAFGLPFVFWDVPTGNVPTYGTESRKPSDIVGSQANPGTFLSADRVIRQDNGNFAYRTPVTAPVWTGSLETPGPLGAMEPARAYWYLNKTASARPIILAGQVDTSAGANLGLPDPIPTVTVTANGYTPISWRDSRVILRSKLGLVAQGFVGGTFLTSDKVIEQIGGRSFTCNLAVPPVWSGTLPDVSPGAAYWIQNKHAAPWNYTYNASGVPLIQNLNTPEIQKIIPSAKETGGKTGAVRK